MGGKNVRVSPGSTGGRAGATCCSCCQGAPNGGDKYNCLLQLSGITVFPFPVLQWSSLHHLHASVKSPESKHCKSLGQYHGIDLNEQPGGLLWDRLLVGQRQQEELMVVCEELLKVPRACGWWAFLPTLCTPRLILTLQWWTNHVAQHKGRPH